MRAITKPGPPQITNPNFADCATALGNAVGRFCSFCEKALTYRLLLFHKQRGVLAPTAQLSSADWTDLLLICGDCSASVTNFNPQRSYFWPDTVDAQQNPYLYTKLDNVSITAQNPNGGTLMRTTASVVLVSVSTDVSQQIQTNAANTYALFRLNGRYFNENFSQPAYTLPYDEYVHSTDARLDQRMDVWGRAVDAGATLVRGIPTIRVEPAYVRNTLAMVWLAVEGFGYLSTWRAGIIATLNAADPGLLPQLLALMTGQPTPTPQPAPAPRLDRKRTANQMNEGVEQANAIRAKKLAKVETALGQIIAAQPVDHSSPPQPET